MNVGNIVVKLNATGKRLQALCNDEWISEFVPPLLGVTSSARRRRRSKIVAARWSFLQGARLRNMLKTDVIPKADFLRARVFSSVDNFRLLPRTAVLEPAIRADDEILARVLDFLLADERDVVSFQPRLLSPLSSDDGLSDPEDQEEIRGGDGLREDLKSNTICREGIDVCENAAGIRELPHICCRDRGLQQKRDDQQDVAEAGKMVAPNLFGRKTIPQETSCNFDFSKNAASLCSGGSSVGVVCENLERIGIVHPCPPQLQQPLPVHCCVQNLCGGVDVHLPSSDGFVMLDVGDEQQLINEAVSEQLLFQCSDGAQAVGGLQEGFAPGPANGGVEVCGSGDLQEEEQQPWMQQLRLFHLPNGAQGSRLSDLRWDGVSQKQGQDGASSSGDDLHCSEFGCFDEDDFDRLAASLDVLESLVELLFDELSLASASQCCCCGGESGDGPLHKSEPPVRSVLCTHKPEAVEVCNVPCNDFALDASCSPTLKDEKLGSCLPDLAGNSDKPTIFNRPFLIVVKLWTFKAAV